MSINTVLVAALAALPLALFSPAQAGEGNGPALDVSNYGSWTFVQVQTGPADVGSEAYVSHGHFTDMVPDAIVVNVNVNVNVGAERPVLAGKAQLVDSMTNRGNVAYARAATGKQPGG